MDESTELYTKLILIGFIPSQQSKDEMQPNTWILSRNDFEVVRLRKDPEKIKYTAKLV